MKFWQASSEIKTRHICKKDGLPHGTPGVAVAYNVSSGSDKDELMKVKLKLSQPHPSKSPDGG